MRDYAEMLAEEVESYTGRHENYIIEAPAFYRLMINMLDDPELQSRLRPLVLAAVAYFGIAGDIIPEELQGPSGYIDDIFLCALMAEYIRRELKSDEILERNWEGQTSIVRLIQDILANEQDLLGGKRNLVLEYVGYDFLKKL